MIEDALEQSRDLGSGLGTKGDSWDGTQDEKGLVGWEREREMGLMQGQDMGREWDGNMWMAGQRVT